uniref:RING-type domain-containing protein n=1 Tax=Oryzias latipes TaxID=8090 RepID=A0A3B3II13_ORYLA
MLSSCGKSFLCSICLELFNQPTSIPCGHTFCLQCITDYWDTSTALLLCPPKQSFTPDQCFVLTFLSMKWKIRSSTRTNHIIETHQKKILEIQDSLEASRTHADEVLKSSRHLMATIKDYVRRRHDELRETHPHIVRSYLQRKRRHAVDVTLQRDAVHPFLAVFDDWKQDYDAYHYRYNVSAKEEFFSGKFYYEVKVKGKTQWYLGVAKESINRSGDIRLRLGVFVGYEEGQVTFYNVGEMDCIFSFTGCAFTEKLFPFFSPCGND